MLFLLLFTIKEKKSQNSSNHQISLIAKSVITFFRKGWERLIFLGKQEFSFCIYRHRMSLFIVCCAYSQLFKLKNPELVMLENLKIIKEIIHREKLFVETYKLHWITGLFSDKKNYSFRFDGDTCRRLVFFDW